MTTFILIDGKAYSLNTEHEAQTAREALRSAGLEYADEWAGLPDHTGDAYKNGSKLFAARVTVILEPAGGGGIGTGSAHNARIIREAAAHATNDWRLLLCSKRDAPAAERYVEHLGQVLLRAHEPEPIDAATILAAEVCALREQYGLRELEFERECSGMHSEIGRLEERIADLHAELELERDNNTKVAEQNDQLELMLAHADCEPETLARAVAFEKARAGSADARGILIALEADDPARAEDCSEEHPPLTNLQRARLWAWNTNHREEPHADNRPNFASLDAEELAQVAGILAERNMYLVIDAGQHYACNNVEPEQQPSTAKHPRARKTAR